jgi:hypothetical protein
MADVTDTIEACKVWFERRRRSPDDGEHGHQARARLVHDNKRVVR